MQGGASLLDLAIARSGRPVVFERVQISNVVESRKVQQLLVMEVVEAVRRGVQLSGQNRARTTALAQEDGSLDVYVDSGFIGTRKTTIPQGQWKELSESEVAVALEAATARGEMPGSGSSEGELTKAFAQSIDERVEHQRLACSRYEAAMRRCTQMVSVVDKSHLSLCMLKELAGEVRTLGAAVDVWLSGPDEFGLFSHGTAGQKQWFLPAGNWAHLLKHGLKTLALDVGTPAQVLLYSPTLAPDVNKALEEAWTKVGGLTASDAGDASTGGQECGSQQGMGLYGGYAAPPPFYRMLIADQAESGLAAMRQELTECGVNGPEIDQVMASWRLSGKRYLVRGEMNGRLVIVQAFDASTLAIAVKDMLKSGLARGRLQHISTAVEVVWRDEVEWAIGVGSKLAGEEYRKGKPGA
ncbi:hypothetical protein [Ottowia sp.]|uniref:hypothetical protein n=1 Tax=Ottowia sp. TaxID=1898956 RepID=UPI0025F16A95|nr:hypothetical protein [Ottowia sp.]MBK6616286.1 hypothetical protein [Ottowia sp.]